MKYIIDNKQFKRFFMVPCCIVDKYLKLASSDAIKILLFLLNSERNGFTTEDIIKETNIKNANIIDEAIIFWQERGIINVNNSDKIEQTPKQEVKQPSTENVVIKKTSTVRYTPRDLARIVEKSDDLKFLMDSVQSVLKRPITFTEQNSIINLFEYYSLPATVILMLIDYCNEIGKSNVHYVQAIAKAWCENGIVTHEAAEAEIIKMIDRNTFAGKVKKIFGISGNLSPTQEKMISGWNSLGLSLDMITYAYEKCLDSINKLSFPYINKVLGAWAKNGYKVREDVVSQSKKEKTTEENTKSYDLDEFYQMALNYTPNNKGE